MAGREGDELDGARSPPSRPSTDNRAMAERTASLAKALTDLSQEDWLKILRQIYNSLLALVTLYYNYLKGRARRYPYSLGPL